MSNEPFIQHWLVSVARSAGLDPEGALEISSEQGDDGAWDVVAMSAGVSQERLAELVGAHYGLDAADLDERDEHASKLIPASVARKIKVVPLRSTHRALVVGTADPVGFEAERVLTRVADRAITFEVAPPAAIAQLLEELYPPSGELRHELPPLSVEAKGGQRILVVDDDAGMRLLLRTAFEDGGYQVTEADDGPAALDALAKGESFALVTLDLQMKEMHGLEVLKRIRGKVATAALPVVVATASDDPAVEMELFEAGADDFVVKPVDPRRFLLRVQAVLRRRSADPFGRRA